jgi:hypothetical protein
MTPDSSSFGGLVRFLVGEYLDALGESTATALLLVFAIATFVMLIFDNRRHRTSSA